MPQPICKCCELERIDEGKDPLLLYPIRRTTELKKLPVLLCKYCDGPATRLANRSDDDWFDPYDYT